LLIEHLKHFRTSGTIVRSSPFLISRLLRAIDFDEARTIVQLGVGTGCITEELLERMHPEAKLLALELNPVFVEECEEAGDPRLILRLANAADLHRIADEAGLGQADYVVSSLPLNMMPDEQVGQILRASQTRLAPGGLFLQYQYSLSHKDELERTFYDVKVGFTLANIPPAFVYECSTGARRAD
jgi:phospholipid N-methyltransferase